MLELFFAAIISLAATCDASSAASGGCGCGASGNSFTICATKSTTQKNVSSVPVKTSAPAPKQSAKPGNLERWEIWIGMFKAKSQNHKAGERDKAAGSEK